MKTICLECGHAYYPEDEFAGCPKCSHGKVENTSVKVAIQTGEEIGRRELYNCIRAHCRWIRRSGDFAIVSIEMHKLSDFCSWFCWLVVKNKSNAEVCLASELPNPKDPIPLCRTSHSDLLYREMSLWFSED